MYVNSFFPPDQKEYNGLLDDNGKASFNIYLYGPAQAILMVGDELSYGYILLDPGEKPGGDVHENGFHATSPAKERRKRQYQGRYFSTHFWR